MVLLLRINRTLESAICPVVWLWCFQKCGTNLHSIPFTYCGTFPDVFEQFFLVLLDYVSRVKCDAVVALVACSESALHRAVWAVLNKRSSIGKGVAPIVAVGPAGVIAGKAIEPAAVAAACDGTSGATINTSAPPAADVLAGGAKLGIFRIPGSIPIDY